MPPPLPGGWDHDCGPDSVPGWINEGGLPTSCVGDLPLVEPLPNPAPIVTPEPLTMLPVTGVEPVDLIAPLALVAVGALCVWLDRAFIAGRRS